MNDSTSGKENAQDNSLDRIHIEEALRESEKKFRAIFESFYDVYYRTDRDGLMTMISPSILNQAGYLPEDVIGRPVTDFYSNASDREVFEEELQKAGFVNDYELKLLTQDGTEIDVSVSAKFVVGDDGEIEGIEGVLRNITERKKAEDALRQSEQRFRALSEAALEGIAVTEKGIVLEVSPRLADMLGYTQDELVGESVIKMVAPESRTLVEKNIRNNVQVPYVHFAQRKDGSVLPVEVHGVFMPWGDSTVRVTAIRNITNRKEAEKKLQDKEHELRQSQKLEAIGQLAGGIAHDFNNILQVVMGFSALAQKDLSTDSNAFKAIEKVLTAGNRGAELAAQILAFSRQTDLEMKPVELQKLLDEVIKIFQGSLASTIDIQVNIDRNCGWVLASSTQIHQVLMNLVTNAHYAMKEKGGILEVCLEEIEIDSENGSLFPDLITGMHAVLTVRDTGKGMDEKVKLRIFEPYFTTKDIGEGTGLGLSIVHGIVSAHKGAISVESAPGVGTTFRIFLPIIQGDMDSFEEELPDSEIPHGTECVLFVDDEESITELGKGFLEVLGYTVIPFSSSLAALDAFTADPDRFDVIVTDYTMPEMTGIELSRRIKTIRPAIPVVLCSGHASDADAEMKISAGISRALQKPFSMEHLAESVRQALDEKEGAS